MTVPDVRVVPYGIAMHEWPLDLSIRVRDAVFEAIRDDLDRGLMSCFVYDNFYPDGWDVRQRVGLVLVLGEETGNCDVTFIDDKIVGWAYTRVHPEDSMGEVYALRADSTHQRGGIGRALMEHAHERTRRVGMWMATVKTGGDVGHAPARATYGAMGYKCWPIARYFKQL